MPRMHASPIRLRARASAFVALLRTTPPRTVCPNFFVLAHANGCAFTPQCDYCYLKSSLWHVGCQDAFDNVDRMETEIRAWIARDDLETYVLNTGNLSDSLCFESVRPMAVRLAELFREAEAAGRPHTLLLVTKGGVRECRALLASRPTRNVIVSFSVNCAAIARRHERGARPVADRLRAARLLRDAGWRVRMRIDPMFAGAPYGALLDALRALAPERVTIGSLRAEPHLLRRVNHGMFAHLERAPEPDGLARYPLAQRIAMYRTVVEALRGTTTLGLCEETREVWEAVGLDADACACNCNA